MIQGESSAIRKFLLTAVLKRDCSTRENTATRYSIRYSLVFEDLGRGLSD